MGCCKSQVEGGGNCFIRRAVWAVCTLEQIECVGEAGFDVVHDYPLKALHYDWS